MRNFFLFGAITQLASAKRSREKGVISLDTQKNLTISGTEPEFLMTLYEQIKNLDQEEQRKLLGQGNTVRSLYPIRAQTAGDSTTWIFDTSRLPSAEVIVRAEIRGDSDQSCIVKLLKMTNQKKSYYKELRSHAVPRTSEAWSSSEVVKMIRKGRHEHHLLATTISQTDAGFTPILVIYANDPGEIHLKKPFDELARRKRSLAVSETSLTEEMKNQKVLGKFQDERHSRRLRRCRKQKQRRKYTRKLPKPDQDCRGIKKVKLAERQEQVARQSKVSCKRRSMYINFEEIGWKEWIIAPLGFDAYYCGGQCGYDEAQYMRKTNHAMMQSIMNRFEPTIPEPSCVPDKMLSLTILFKDTTSGHNVLRVFPDMTVSSCSCR